MWSDDHYASNAFKGFPFRKCQPGSMKGRESVLEGSWRSKKPVLLA